MLLATFARCSILAAALAPALAVSGQATPGRSVVHVPPHVACAECRIELRKTSVFGDEDGDGLLPRMPDVFVRMPDGSLLIAGGAAGPVPLLYNSRGKFLRALGRQGAGPGEFLGVQAAFVQGDSVFLFDRGNSRMLVLTREFAVVRHAPAPSLVHSAAPIEGGFVLGASIMDASRIGFPVHLFSRLGTYVRHAGDSAETVTLRTGVRATHVASAQDGGFWSVPWYGEYAVRKWDARGKLAKTLVLHSPWYDASREPRNITPTSRPMSEVSRVWQDADGLIWILARVAADDWAKGLGPAQEIERRVGHLITDPERVWDGMIEVIDPLAGRVLARRKVDFLPYYRADDNLIAAYREVNDIPRLEGYSVRLVGRRPR
jgi:hypothetical protein